MYRVRVADYDFAGARTVKFMNHWPKDGGREDPDEKEHYYRQPQPETIFKSRLPSADERSEHPTNHQDAQRLEEISRVHWITRAVRH